MPRCTIRRSMHLWPSRGGNKGLQEKHGVACEVGRGDGGAIGRGGSWQLQQAGTEAKQERSLAVRGGRWARKHDEQRHPRVVQKRRPEQGKEGDGDGAELRRGAEMMEQRNR